MWDILPPGGRLKYERAAGGLLLTARILLRLTQTWSNFPYRLLRWEPDCFARGETIKQDVAGRVSVQRLRVPSAILAATLAFTACATPLLAATHQTPGQAENTAAQRATSTPYAGDLSIFETPGRDTRLQIDRVMTLLGITKGKSVADIGAGSGWFTVRAARRAGSTGTVFAEDINPDAIRTIETRAKKEQLTNIRTIQGTPDHLKLPADSVDAALLLKVYHEIAHPVPVMKELRATLKTGGRVGIIDRNGNGTDHGLDRAVVEREMQEAGFKVKERYDFTKADGQDYFLIFVAK